MEVSRITFTKETLAKIKRGMSAQEKGKVLYERLCEASDNGLLAQCKTRRDVSELVGYTGETKQQRQRGYSWITNLIRRKNVSEVLVAPGEYQYFLGPKKPDYDLTKAKWAKGTNRVNTNNTNASTDTIKSSTEEPVILSRVGLPADRKAQISLKSPNGLVVNFIDVDIEIASKVIESVVKMMSEYKTNGETV